MPRTIVAPTRPAAPGRHLNRNVLSVPARRKQSLIQWPTAHQILEVSKRLAALRRLGARAEVEGDYFFSGDLAYQMHEIIRTTADLFRKGQRLKE
jgi:hypothetical protein